LLRNTSCRRTVLLPQNVTGTHDPMPSTAVLSWFGTTRSAQSLFGGVGWRVVG
jgi:hypothetical protein